MRKNKVFATAAIAALAAAQMAMPAMAATTNNGKENLGDKNNAALTENLKKDGHTLFSVFETDKELAGQVSFTVPLYVTMAAKNNEDAMVVPEGYFIENNGNEAIGITGIAVRTYGQWSIVDANPTGDHQMTFSLNKKNGVATEKFTFPKLPDNKETTLFSRNDWKKEAAGETHGAGFNDLLKGKEYFFFSDKTMYGANNPGFKPITGKMELEMASEIDVATRNDTKTVPAFQVTYTLSALDAQGQPKSSTYIGDDKDQAMAEVVGVN